MTSAAGAAAAGTIDIGGDREVRRIGFGAMRLTGHGIRGEPPDGEQAGRAPAGGSSGSTSSTPRTPMGRR